MDSTLRLTNPYMRGTDVSYVQERLGVKADGLFGPNTEKAVSNF
jgi:hypothetical protein